MKQSVEEFFGWEEREALYHKRRREMKMEKRIQFRLLADQVKALEAMARDAELSVHELARRLVVAVLDDDAAAHKKAA